MTNKEREVILSKVYEISLDRGKVSERNAQAWKERNTEVQRITSDYLGRLADTLDAFRDMAKALKVDIEPMIGEGYKEGRRIMAKYIEEQKNNDSQKITLSPTSLS